MIEQDVSARVHPAVIELQREVLRSGHPLRIRLYGMSMYPIVQNGDVAVVRPTAWTDLRRGDVIFYERESRLIAHRVMVAPFDDASPAITKGDTLWNFDPPVRPTQLLGRVEAIERDTRAFSLTSRRGRLIQRCAAEVSGPYSRLFWRVAAWRRRLLRALLRFPAYRERRRRGRPTDARARPCGPDDLDLLTNCLWDLMPGRTFAAMREWTADRLRRLDEEGISAWVVEEGRRIVGVALLSPATPGHAAWMIDWYVHLLARGCGWGRLLLETVEAEAASRRDAELLLRLPAASTAAATLLRDRGWRRVPTDSPVLADSPGLPERWRGLAFQPASEGVVWRRVLSEAGASSESPEPSSLGL